MNSKNHQAGWTVTGLLGFMVLGAFALTCALKLIPVYMEHSSVASAIEQAIDEDAFKGKSTGEIRRKISKSFEMNMVEDTNARAVSISRKKGMTTINANYEKRMPFIANIDIVVKFDDLAYEFRTD
ncbi:DUF4845 domain-containing protein [Oceanicoccus sagamiensis]|uniref:DUF4845 domain-containing protein n=1 Tax=Oceanicoccus sagamiensis TaxID=716816 RepID=A0A1X9NKI9_9GAMM|nr:DUF4845 domain-containing protein [Oceanicoccus sagamiensis]ARN75357.1 hypothetical protein BST96_15290 [Oceanicoccus sagamiensis]